MERFRCTNLKCRQPVLFEGEFVGIVKKICPQCKEMIIFERTKTTDLEKFCKTNKN